MTIAIFKYERQNGKLVKVYFSITGKWTKSTGGCDACLTMEQAKAKAASLGAMTRVLTHRY